jgi:hypothetical protein
MDTPQTEVPENIKLILSDSSSSRHRRASGYPGGLRKSYMTDLKGQVMMQWAKNLWTRYQSPTESDPSCSESGHRHDFEDGNDWEQAHPWQTSFLQRKTRDCSLPSFILQKDVTSLGKQEPKATEKPGWRSHEGRHCSRTTSSVPSKSTSVTFRTLLSPSKGWLSRE